MDRRKYLATVGALLTAGCAGDVDETPTTEETTREPDTTTAMAAHDIGESFTVGSGAKSIRYRVTKAILFEEAIGSSMVYTEPDGVFVCVILEMENVGDETLDISTRHLKLVDGEGRTFEADTEALSYATNDGRIEAEPIMFDQLQPGLRVTRSVIYDVPTGQGYVLLVEPAGMFSNAESHFVPLGRT